MDKDGTSIIQCIPQWSGLNAKMEFHLDIKPVLHIW